MKTLYLQNSDLTRDKKFTYLSSDATNGTATLSVQSIVGFAVNQILCIGEIGNEKTEIIKTHAVTAPTGTTITLASNLVFDHPQDTKVYIIDYDQFEVSWSATTGGAKGVLATQNIQADLLEGIYNDTVETAGYYFIRFKETIGGTFSSYSDPIPFGGFDDNTVFAIKKRALDYLNEKVDGNLITDEFLNEALWDGRREYHQSPGKRPFRRKFNFSIGSVATGVNRIYLPIDVEKPWTAENIYNIRIGVQPSCVYYDKKLFDTDFNGVAHTTLTSLYTVGDLTLTCNNTGDFADSGSVMIEGESISYSANNRSTNVLTVSVAGKKNHASSSDVWQNISTGLPTRFTVFADALTGSAYIYFNTPFDTFYVGQNIWADYYKTVVALNSDSGALDEPDYDIFVYYLIWRIKQRKANGTLPLTDPDFVMWQTKKQMALNKEYLGTQINISPEVGHLPIPN